MSSLESCCGLLVIAKLVCPHIFLLSFHVDVVTVAIACVFYCLVVFKSECLTDCVQIATGDLRWKEVA
jgi:hypothetical protein